MTTEPIRVEFSWTKEDYIEANELYQKLEGTKLWKVCVLAVGIITLTRLSHEGIHIDWFIWGWSLVLAVPFLYLLRRMGRPLNRLFYARQIKKETVIGKPIFFEASPEHLIISSPDSDGKVKWTLFNRWVESDRLFLLLAGRLMYIVPKRVLKLPAEMQLKSLLIEKIGPHGQKKAT